MCKMQETLQVKTIKTEYRKFQQEQEDVSSSKTSKTQLNPVVFKDYIKNSEKS